MAHAVGLCGAAVLLWAFSVPGVAVFSTLVGLAMLGVAALLWAVAAQLSHSAGRTWPLWLPIAPALAIVTLALLTTRAPLHARWEFSQDAFDRVVAELPKSSADTSFEPVKVPERIGGYRIISANLVPGGVILYGSNGAFFNDAGFAYLPDGPNPSLDHGGFESPVFRPLGDGWYRWTASW
ncbi:hypothetical protein [Micromonospora sp. C95]|uniref:hypothetical protein n=1 Tax=Micromonospora sp. C95 TaxID=2824882 RepID=UPI001B3940D8|nr:hypothetical protein [Micromonospora sp. C95]MBQ1028323.1 hypothetical protein [Micromonospora sp. C95]